MLFPIKDYPELISTELVRAISANNYDTNELDQDVRKMCHYCVENRASASSTSFHHKASLEKLAFWV